jgi:hypothetical protein
MVRRIAAAWLAEAPLAEALVAEALLAEVGSDPVLRPASCGAAHAAEASSTSNAAPGPVSLRPIASAFQPTVS